MPMECDLLTCHPPRDSLLARVPRTLGGLLGALTLLNLLGEAVRPGFDANLWWIDLHFLPTWLAGGLLLSGGVLLCAWACRPRMTAGRARATRAVVALLALVCMANAIQVCVLVDAGVIRTTAPAPL